MCKNELIFHRNWNNKLNCDYFTKLVFMNSEIYEINSIFKVLLKTKAGIIEFKPVRLIATEHILLRELDDYFCYTDYGLSRSNYISMIIETYNIRKYQMSQILFSKLLLEKITNPLLFE